MLGKDPNQAAEEMARWAEQLERTAQRYQDLHGRMTEISVTERSADNHIAVTVNADGATTGIDLASGTRGMEPAAVAAELMACTRRAQARLRERVTDLVHDMVGEDGAGRAIVAQYAERFPDPASSDPASSDPASSDPAPEAYTPPAAPAPSPTRAAGRAPTRPVDEPNQDDLYYRRRSWLD